MKKILTTGAVLLGLGAIIIGLQIENAHFDQSSVQPEVHKLTADIQNDLLDLSKQKALPAEMNDLYEETVISTSPQTTKWENLAKTNIATKKTGLYRLQTILIAENPERADTRLMIQFELYNRHTDNKIWEIVRIYRP
ncbi:MAG: hypothetical protein RJB66_804 [Pseudomonadota bacterium]|jgi:hypothetical protein